MRIARSIALLLAPDLHEVARRVTEAERALGVIQDSVVALGNTAVGGEALREMIVEDLVETRARLIEVRADLTGRGVDQLNRG